MARPGRPRSPALASSLAVVLVLAGCGSFMGSNPLRPSAGMPPAAASSNPVPDARGVITYASYQVAVARDSDTLASVAERLGIAPAELAARNALPLDYRLRAGEVLLLPDSVPRPSFDVGPASGEIVTEPLGWSKAGAAAAIDDAPPPPPAQTPFEGGEREPLIDPVRHRVEPGETAYSIARLYGVTVTALASWNGLGADLAVRENQELLIPIVSGANRVTGSLDAAPGGTSGIAPPASAAAPLPDDIVAGAVPASPELGQYRTPPGGKLSPPVAGPVRTPYNLTPGPARSEGILYGVPAGTAVGAAGDGEVALVSDSLGGLGTIVLIRHPDDLMTVYGRIDGVRVERGQRVAAGETIGEVAAGDNPGLHFEVRRGTDSVDPALYIGG